MERRATHRHLLMVRNGIPVHVRVEVEGSIECAGCVLNHAILEPDTPSLPGGDELAKVVKEAAMNVGVDIRGLQVD
jgi:hypothetical protein